MEKRERPWLEGGRSPEGTHQAKLVDANPALAKCGPAGVRVNICSATQRAY